MLHFMHRMYRDHSVIWILPPSGGYLISIPYDTTDMLLINHHYFAHFPHSVSQFTSHNSLTLHVGLSECPACLPPVRRYPGSTAHAQTQLLATSEPGPERRQRHTRLPRDKMWHIIMNMSQSVMPCIICIYCLQMQILTQGFLLTVCGSKVRTAARISLFRDWGMIVSWSASYPHRD